MCQKAFDDLKIALTSDIMLTRYDPNKEIYVANDASNLGLGSCTLTQQNGHLKAVHHALRNLLPVEINYSQIEKKSSGLIFAVKKFHKYIHIRFHSSNWPRPLLSIFGSKKGIPTHSATHLQRWGTILLNYSLKWSFYNLRKYHTWVYNGH